MDLGMESMAAALARGTTEDQALITRRVSALEGHDLWAESYDQKPNPLLALEERFLKPLLPILTGKFALDVACGTGRWLTHLLAGDAHQGVGVDLSSEMTLRATEKPSLRGRVIRADCLALPISDARADVVICSFAAGYVHDLRMLARELGRVLRRPADAFITDLHPAALARGWRRSFRHGSEVLEISSVHYSIDQLCQCFAAEGFGLMTRLEPSMGEPERDIFKETGKDSQFETACRVPAIFICHFKLRTATPAGRTS